MSKLNSWVCRNRLITNTLLRWRPGCWIEREKKENFSASFLFWGKNASILSVFCNLCSEIPSFYQPSVIHQNVHVEHSVRGQALSTLSTEVTEKKKAGACRAHTWEQGRSYLSLFITEPFLFTSDFTTFFRTIRGIISEWIASLGIVITHLFWSIHSFYFQFH